MNRRIALTHAEYLQSIFGSLDPDPDDDMPILSPILAAGELRSRGYDVTADEVRLAYGDDIDPADVERLADLLESQGRYSAEAAYLARQGLTMSDKHDALMAAHDAARANGRAARDVLGYRPDESYYICSISLYGRSEISFALHPLVLTKIEGAR